MFWILRPSKNMMAFKSFCAAAFFAFSDFIYFFFNYKSRFVISFCNPSFPFRMIFFLWWCCYLSAPVRTIILCSTGSFSAFKRIIAILTSIFNNNLRSFFFYFMGTRARASMCFGSDVCVWARKFISACFANQSCVTASFYLPKRLHKPA